MNRGESGSRGVVYCVIPVGLAERLHDVLRRHFRDDPEVAVIVERRRTDRRGPDDRRRAMGSPAKTDRRLIRNIGGRRVGERRTPFVTIAPPGALPRRARAHLTELLFLERLEPSSERLEDLDTARLVTRIQAGSDEFDALYMRYFDRVYSYLRVVLRDEHQAEDASQHVFMKVLEALPRYERRRQPFRAWLFAIARNQALTTLDRDSRVDVREPVQIDRWREADAGEDEPRSLGWISDRDLLLFIERLPLAQRQVLALRFMLDLPNQEVAEILGRSVTDVRTLQSRGISFLRKRLSALGREAPRGGRIRMRRWGAPANVVRARRFALYR